MPSTATGPSRIKAYHWLFLFAVMVGLYLTTLVNYLLFHTLIELFSIVIASSVFIITFNSLQYIRNPYLLTVGISYLFIGILDLLHTIAYKGMPIFVDYDYYANQLWVAARYLESITLLVAFFLLFIKKQVRAGMLVLVYLVVTALLIASIFYWKTFPVCFIEGKGLTPFKIYSEYAICLILTASGCLLIRNRRRFSGELHRLILYSIIFAIVSELSFTLYTDNYGITNMVGHYFKLFSFLMIYRAIVSTGIESPYRLIFQELNDTNQSLQKEIQLRKELETERERATESLRESEARFRSLFESTPDAVFITAPVGRIVAANPAACAMFGWSEEEICRLGRDGLICLDDPRHQAVIEERERTGRFEKAELCFKRKDGERFPGETDSVMLPGEERSAFVIIRDITERKRTEAALKELNQKLEQRVAQRTAELHEKDQILLLQSRQAAMGEMIGHIAHQWRQPLNTLGLLVQEPVLTQQMGRLTPEYLEENAKTAMEVVQHMSRTIDDFRNFFRPDKEKVSFRLNEVVAKTLSLVEGSLKEQKIAVELLAHGDPEVHGFPNEFSQVLLNLLFNARDALVERKVAAPRVVLETASEEGRSVLTVTDNAGGIPEAILDKIFQPYFTTKGARGGTGVGLSMSKSIIEKNMGGRLTVRNVESGAQFRIEV